MSIHLDLFLIDILFRHRTRSRVKTIAHGRFPKFDPDAILKQHYDRGQRFPQRKPEYAGKTREEIKELWRHTARANASTHSQKKYHASLFRLLPSGATNTARDARTSCRLPPTPCSSTPSRRTTTRGACPTSRACVLSHRRRLRGAGAARPHGAPRPGVTPGLEDRGGGWRARASRGARAPRARDSAAIGLSGGRSQTTRRQRRLSTCGLRGSCTTTSAGWPCMARTVMWQLILCGPY